MQATRTINAGATPHPDALFMGPLTFGVDFQKSGILNLAASISEWIISKSVFGSGFPL